MSLKGLQLSLAWEINASCREILQVYKDLVLEGMPAPTPPVDLIDWVCVKSGRFTHSKKEFMSAVTRATTHTFSGRG